MTKLLSSLSLLFVLFGCCSQEYVPETGTPTVTKHAKRAYNKPYKIKGEWYHPQPVYNYSEQGVASYYGGGDVFHGRATSTGEKFDMHALTAAHKTLPLPSIVRVTNLKNGRSVKLKVVDRGPFIESRIIDVSRKAARLLGFENDGLAKVLVEAQVKESVLLAMNYHPKKPTPEFAANPQDNFLDKSKSVKYLAQKKADKNNSFKSLKNPLLLTAAQQPESNLRSSKILSAASQVSSGIYIQVGSYSHSSTARQVAREVQDRHKMPAKAYGSKKNKNSQFKVLAGPFNSSEKAKKLLNRIKTVGHPYAFVTSL